LSVNLQEAGRPHGIRGVAPCLVVAAVYEPKTSIAEVSMRGE
jgi:hypothetical protein